MYVRAKVIKGIRKLDRKKIAIYKGFDVNSVKDAEKKGVLNHTINKQ